ncbi:Peptidase M23 [Leadbetterella byssophila DSM 17132]|jgi:murein DD-endopeptidase MepM/ murein hydrolase activator NlpD|uniref:Peptidase M23 n=1 Tax=Leadbetterella byssophila (strain DSM 17132 / JCM 16389 / KACC 11308 / NBRC 106382 / 4M15) TaxID=649349 RepID=E4RS29_LEAB4|nr:M23 family metallopeptidase [Leadbetterella byssophila]ADQ15845.1 Peptidase M23 [Leadbetterella byssophila DSM 17132]
MNFKKYLFFVFVLLALPALAQKKEKGKIVNAPKIPQNTKNTKKETPKKDEFDFIFEDEPKLRFSNQYEGSNTNKAATPAPAGNYKEGIKIEPLRDLSTTVHEDTSSIDEGELLIVEIEEDAQFGGSESMVNIASYYSVWDTKSLNPYGISPKDFSEVVNITLFNEKEGRNWAKMLDKFRLSSHFGWRNRRWHKGTDLALDTGDKVYAAFDGIVRIAGWYNGYGRTVMVRHYNGLETLYGHLSKITYEPNTLVKAGDVIGLGGSTGRSSGPHLHYETRYEGNQFDSENIYDYTNNEIKIRTQEFTVSSRLYDYLRGKPSVPAGYRNGSVPTGEALDETSDLDEFEEEIPVKVETKAWYSVRKGDTLYSIARKFNMTAQQLAKLNKIPLNKKIYPGLRLRVR